jgi:hypothetical protein
VDIIGNAVATWLVIVCGRLGTRGKGWIFGSNIERCLQRVAESAVRKVVNDAAPYLEESMRSHIADLLRRFLAQPDVVQRLIGPVMTGDVEASVEWRLYVEQRLAMIDWPTLPDVRLAEVITGLPVALHSSLVEEGSRPASPLFPMLVMLGLQELRLGMRALHKQASSRVVADSASAAGYAAASQAT